MWGSEYDATALNAMIDDGFATSEAEWVLAGPATFLLNVASVPEMRKTLQSYMGASTGYVFREHGCVESGFGHAWGQSIM